MAGYIGTKAVNLSTTGADINGNANVDGTLDVTGGDVSFYEDTGATVKFLWDASAESLTLSGSGAGSLTLDRGASGNQLKFENAGATLGYFGYADGTGFAIAGSDGAADVTIDASGNVGIGITAVDTPLHVSDGTAAGTHYVATFVGGSASTVSDEAVVRISTNTGGADLRGVAISAKNTTGSSQGHDMLFYTNAASATPTERMRITSAGFVGIGTASPATKLDVAGQFFATCATSPYTTDGLFNANARPSKISTPGAGAELLFGYQDDSSGQYNPRIGFKNGTAVAATDASNSIGNVSDGSLTFNTSASNLERMRITSAGNLLVGTTTSGFGNDNGFSVESVSVTQRHINGTSAGTPFTWFIYNGGSIGSITQSGTTGVSYNTSSDYRLKEDVQPMTGASARVQALKPVNFAWVADGSRVDGFLAHEAQEVVPECATGTKDAMKDEEYEVTPAVYEDVVIPAVEAVAEVPAVYDEEGVLVSDMVPAVEAQLERTEQNLVTEAVMGTRSVPDYQGIDQSKIVPLLTAALQEALTKIDALETRLTALEA